MKNLFKYTMGVLVAGAMMTACSPDSFDGADPNGIPTMDGVDFNISVDQETNQMGATYTHSRAHILCGFSMVAPIQPCRR